MSYVHYYFSLSPLKTCIKVHSNEGNIPGFMYINCYPRKLKCDWNETQYITWQRFLQKGAYNAVFAYKDNWCTKFKIHGRDRDKKNMVLSCHLKKKTTCRYLLKIGINQWKSQLSEGENCSQMGINWFIDLPNGVINSEVNIPMILNWVTCLLIPLSTYIIPA